MTVFSSAFFNQPELANKTECLVTNGNGSFASLAVNGGYSRKFHGLLVHAAIPPMDRFLTWHACIEQINGISLDARQYHDPNQRATGAGSRFITRFSARPIPTWEYTVNGHLLRKELFMVAEQETTIVRYTLLASTDDAVSLTLENYVHFRPAEGHNPELSTQDIDHWHIDANQQRITCDAMQLKLGCQMHGQKSQATCQWHDKNLAHQISQLAYDIELQDQGFDQYDASLHVQTSHITLAAGESISMIGTLEAHWPSAETSYHQAITDGQEAFFTNAFCNDLAHSAQQFIAQRESVNGKTILAGFPWFGDWGRDTMIALPGITLSTGRFDVARSILSTFAHYLNGGMLPNKFPDRSVEPLKYNTIDATLWFFWAIQQYVDYSGDWAWVQDTLYKDMLDIVRHYQKGTRYGIGMAEDGLIQGGDAQTQLTWMDVKFDDYAVTPRYGKAVEINALWYNALRFTEQCAQQFNDAQPQLPPLIAQVESAFRSAFWRPDNLGCYDYITPEHAIADVRCNQIFAVSLPFSALTEEQQSRVVNEVHRQLYTPVGLRSLSPEHKDYRGTYYGALRDRDMAYHQGTVWAWPMGAFIEAHLKVHKDKATAARLLQGMKRHFYTEAGVHAISEVFDGDAPHVGRGCFNQAWSVAECLRVIAKYHLDV